ncbi:acyl-CoA N-acyltransferase [Ilyonectria robusta]|uniref:acyl-CoA N-acyltransferase n=1 Tax=Ilyonectria robusta TaxID=1079257 RepID=UPI001E8E898F|nr:acyl-CoA N-acyltransferase [Ilyonectria robusta]KAH8734223.1 acyl-CoA N-acyltransferase [Ilyonectria robusta]
MANNDLHFRIATLDDASQLQAMVESAFRAEDSRQDWTADMKLGESFRLDVKEIITQINKPDGAILMATDNNNNALVGSVEVFKRSDDLARISMLAVDQTCQRGGIGRQVLAYAEDYCQKTWGVNKLGLNALETRQELIKWYMRRGYEKTGETSPFPRDRVAELDLPEDLCFIELEKDVKAAAGATEAV